LRRGSSGTSVVELHDQLARAALAVQGDSRERFGASTEETVRAFQRRRQLQVDGICGPDTWSALGEELLVLGDRLLSLRRPMLRGDDVRELQQQLSGIGFDAGRTDGIFGPQTDTALRDFQRNAAVAVDGICGRDTLDAMRRVGGERESFAASPRALPGRTILLGTRVAAAAQAVEAIAGHLGELGAICTTTTVLEVDTDAARVANELDVDLCVLIQHLADPTWRSAYYQSGRYRSFRGHAIALRIGEELASAAAPVTGSQTAGLSGGVLRETRMAAVVVQLDLEPADLLGRACGAVTAGIRRGFEDPPELAPT
jgi:N-acetylmuramoyl-L-alanine amidase